MGRHASTSDKITLRIGVERKARWAALAEAAGLTLTQWLQEIGDTAAAAGQKRSKKRRVQ
jgi:hypothetical protein